MGVIKTSKSGKSVQFITDDGIVYSASIKALSALMYKNNPEDFLVLVRLPLNVSPDRYPKSKLYTKEGLVDINEKNTTGDDAFSEKSKKVNKEVKQFKDKKVW